MTQDRRGRCYELAAKYVVEHGDASLRLCHGWPVLRGNDPHAGKRYGHAWVERTTFVRYPYEGQIMKIPTVDCLDTLSGEWCPKALYYGGGRIDPTHVTTLDFAEAVERLDAEACYGPWTESPYDDLAPVANEVTP